MPTQTVQLLEGWIQGWIQGFLGDSVSFSNDSDYLKARFIY